MYKRCAICGILFNARGRDISCSLECRKELRRRRERGKGKHKRNRTSVQDNCEFFLGEAIILQAIKDYAKHPDMRKEIERFFNSAWYEVVNGGKSDGEALLNRLKRLVED